ncbi:MAG: hypothetical protein AB8B97_25205 [Granulosicoccus sp.]
MQYNYGRYKNEEFDALIEQANSLTDVKERADILRQAEQIAMDESAAIPIYYYLSRNVVSPKVSGFENNAFDIHRTRWLSISE